MLDIAPGLAINPQLQWEIEQFLYEEADLLDAWRWDDWLKLLAPDVHYVCTLRPSRYHRDLRKETSGATETAIFDDDYRQLEYRVWQLGHDRHWAENPGSRTRRLINNVRLRPGDSTAELKVTSNFLLYRTRGERQMDQFVGQRQDVLTAAGEGDSGWRIRSRRIVLDMATLLSSNLSVLL